MRSSEQSNLQRRVIPANSKQIQRGYKEILQGVGAIVGAVIGFVAAYNLTPERLVGIPYVNPEAAQKLPIEIYRVGIFFMTAGVFANYLSNFGIAIDTSVKGVRTLYHAEDRLQWLKECTPKNSGHVIGAITGAAAAILFMCVVAESDGNFSLMGGVQDYLPKWLLQLMALFLIAGANSNLLSHAFEGTQNSFVNAKAFVSTVGTLFARNTETTLELAITPSRPEV